MIRKNLAGIVGVALLVLCCSAAHAANTGPTYTATLKLGKGNVATGSTLTVAGKGFDFYSLLSLSAVATPKKGASTTMNEQVAVYTSNANSGTLTTNANATLVFFSTSNTGTITTNGNVNKFTISYTVKVTNKGVVTAKSDRSNKAISFSAVQGVASKNKFKFVFTGTQVDAAVAKLPTITKGKNTIPSLTGVTGFTVKLGSATFVGTAVKNKIVF